jgi:hypothetical protein
MKPRVAPLDLQRLKVYPLAQRRSLSRIGEILVQPDAVPPVCPDPIRHLIDRCAGDVRRARDRNAAVLLMCGAHLVKNGGAALVERLLAGEWITHLATNGAGVIHDWEFAFQEWSTESVKDNVAAGTFGTWDETGRHIHLAVLAGAVRGEGFGVSMGRFIEEDGLTLPSTEELETSLRAQPDHPLAPARADLLLAVKTHGLKTGRHRVGHPWKHASMLAGAFRHQVPATVHPGIGYDIISNHPMFNGAALGRAAGLDFRLIGGTIEGLDGGVVLSVGSAIMAPQVFEKSLSCVNNLRLQDGRPVVRDHSFYVVDLQDGGHWDWTGGEPPKDNPAYYLRFCKSFSRMGGVMHYVQSDNVLFVHHLLRRLQGS